VLWCKEESKQLVFNFGMGGVTVSIRKKVFLCFFALFTKNACKSDFILLEYVLLKYIVYLHSAFRIYSFSWG